MYGVYIIESLREEDYFDGENLHEILKLSNIESLYRFVISPEDFRQKIDEFFRSGFRYLHISCHASMEGIEINHQFIPNSELSIILKNKISNKRIFLSACKTSNRDFAERTIKGCSAQSLVGSPIKIHFDKAALFWPSFYHVINKLDNNKMTQKSLKIAIKKCVDLFGVPINYYTAIKNNPNKIKRFKFRENEKVMVKFLSV